MAVELDVLVLYGIYIGVPLFIAVFLYKYLYKNKKKIEDFKEQPLKTTLFDELKKKLEQFGINTKGYKIIRDFQIVGHPRKYMMIDIEMPKYSLDSKTKEVMVTKDDPIKTRLMIIKSGNRNIVLRFFHLRDNYFIFELKQGFENLLNFESEKKRIAVQGLIDFETFGNVWIMSESGHEYLSNISIKRALEQNTMHSENMADRVVHYDIQQAKLERRDRIVTDLEKSKWEDKKDVGDSTII